MTIIELKNVSKTFFSQNLYKHVDLTINPDEKIALIGNNGTGKSTLIKLITGEENPNRGEIIIDDNAQITSFDQFGHIDLEKNVTELLNLPFKKVIDTQLQLDEMSKKFSEETENYDLLMEEYSILTDKFESLGGYSYLHIQEEFIETFELNDKLNKKFKELSGGEKQYIRLAITLFSEANLVILDEPLSFFDKKKTAWLSNYITESTKAFVIISHNVDFIRSFATKIFDVDNNRITTYECGYNQFLKAKKIKMAEDKKHNLEKDLVIDKTTTAVAKKCILLEKCDNKHAQAVILRRMRRELTQLNREKIQFSPEYKYEYTAPPKEIFSTSRDIGENIASLINISKEYPDKVLYRNANLEILKDTKIAIVGENGCGKSTLLKILTGQEPVSSGQVILNPLAKVSYIEQETIFENENITTIEYLRNKTGLSYDFIEEAIDTLYNNEPEFRDKRIFMLSGGEKKRIEIFANILSETDLLIIDEPSTYMDSYSRITIANMLLEYPGAIILVSHDKTLLRQVNFTTYDIRDRKLRLKESGNTNK